MFFKKLMIWMITITVLISLSSNSWFIYWLMMEMNMMSFIPLMNNYKLKNLNAMITYFVVQAFSSSLFFLSAFQYNMMQIEFFLFLINISILIKLGMIPFHLWLISISEMMNFNSILILLTMQKIIPLLIAEKFMNNSLIPLFSMSTFFASFLAMKHKLMKKILIFSSISHQGWILCLLVKKLNFWIAYLMLYFIIFFNIISIFNKYKINFFSDFMKKKMKLEIKIKMIMLMMSLGGMPPFLGFFMKIVSIYLLMNLKLIFIFMLILSSLLNLFFYMRMIIPFFFINLKFFTWNNIFMNKNIYMNMNLIILIVLIYMYM
uniref:NADH-ubiquinone oxidoreductase chain 2 n=2 Tax=Rhipicephalus microplus TaxID=6941 RepID=V9MM10_RHIMP|nr:NADH dehydrogenase subunit 2 [Rhipicephalus microplus]AGH19732.1 NADH dehydrogenase subunit 2 [Rhipicephalus microplus]AKC05528.1 NADH dehydrogenase subunit 2 [Rhipicephalus microplus]QLD97310.1 NADH dehydrogenase subunit 2 [Rhipicephalus microplus]QNN85482.1 NADH dehydrogenase subunit 2 [Rhipicephalus microplus]QNN85495.1 NADH dehydrogenase subunit 2 [Rhipicephalus microplus]